MCVCTFIMITFTVSESECYVFIMECDGHCFTIIHVFFSYFTQECNVVLWCKNTVCLNSNVLNILKEYLKWLLK